MKKVVFFLLLVLVVVLFTGCPAIGYLLGVQVNGLGTISINPEKLLYAPGETVQLTATPEYGWQFSGWTGDYVSQNQTIYLNMNGNMFITAVFTPLSPTTQVVIENSNNAYSVNGIENTLNNLGYGVHKANLSYYVLNTAYDKAVIITAPMNYFSSSAINNLTSYLSAGGKLILLADGRNASNIYLNNLINELNNNFVGINFSYGTIGFSGYNDNIIFQNTSLGNYFNTGNIKALHGWNIVNAPSNIRVAYATGNAPENEEIPAEENIIDEIGTYLDVLVAEDCYKGKVIGCSSMETFNNVYGAASTLLNRMINW
ncbi:MAG: hypothetical protein PWQ77_2206 [Kosmotogales bacterium]|nr:hypothetical protein [Kosmotogales bacterium]